jgi:hypothetical protein
MAFQGALVSAGLWGVFTKAGEPSWTCLIPCYNLVVLTRIAGIDWGWAVLFLICPVNLIFWVVVCDQVAIKFGKGIGYSLGLSGLGLVYYPLLGFGPAVYEGGKKRRRKVRYRGDDA